MQDRTLDLRGLRCPLPVLRTGKALRALPEGSVMVVHCTDPLATIDISHLLSQTGDHLLGIDHADGVSTFRVRKAASGEDAHARWRDLPAC